MTRAVVGLLAPLISCSLVLASTMAEARPKERAPYKASSAKKKAVTQRKAPRRQARAVKRQSPRTASKRQSIRPASRSSAGADRSGERSARLRWPPMRLEHVNSRERLTVSLFDRRGRTDRQAVRRLQRFMRCTSSGKQRSIDWRLLRNLYRLSRAYAGRTIYVYSGYRSPRRGNRRSYHTRGQAIDLRVAGISNRALQAHIRRHFERVGVGYYPNSHFVHMDVRAKRSAFWVDHSGPGERPQYARNAYRALAAEAEGDGEPARTGAKVATLDRPRAAGGSDTGDGEERRERSGAGQPGGRREGAKEALPASSRPGSVELPVPGPPPVGPSPEAITPRGMGRPAAAPPR